MMRPFGNLESLQVDFPHSSLNNDTVTEHSLVFLIVAKKNISWLPTRR
jgi:hypothetical protein